MRLASIIVFLFSLLQHLSAQEAIPMSNADSLALASQLATRCDSLMRAGNYKEALSAGKEAMALRQQAAGEDSEAYAESLNDVARCNSYLGNYIEAIRLGRKSIEIKSRLLGKENASYALSISNMAGYYSRLGDYDEAIKLGQEALEIRERVSGKGSADYAQSLNNLSKYYYLKKDYDQAILLADGALAIRSQLMGKESREYATTLSNKADYLAMKGDYAQAMACGREAMDIRRRVLGEHHPDYAESLSNMASYHYALGNWSEAVRYGREVTDIRRDILGEDHQSYAHSLCKLAAYYSANEQPDSAEMCAYSATQRYTNSILNTFADLTSSEREMFWMRMKPWFTNIIYQLTSANPSRKMVSSAYNGTLIKKGLLLNSEIEMVNLLMESGDSALISSYILLQQNQSLLHSEYDLPLSQRTLNTDSLQRVITKQERHLLKRSKTYGNYTKPLRISWDKIWQQLGTSDIAIEFVNFRTKEGKEKYAALLLSRQSSYPIYLELCDANSITSIPSKSIYSTTKLSALIWQPIMPYLANATNVYFAPSGELYNIGIESLLNPDNSGTYLNDRWNFYRLSSTREIVLRRERQRRPSSSVVVYGGVDYDSDLSDGDGSTSKSRRKNGAQYLPGTRKEANEITNTLEGDGMSTTVHLGSTASESSIKSLSGAAPNILHIATHGFYWTDSEVRDGNMDTHLQFLSMYGNMDDADQAMTRSGLLLAGANYALTGGKSSTITEDGVLTAKEISLLDLRNVDLLVLSACQTGLGKITGDGVFGLQRGFKKAGANAILMSLWKVDDKATRELMTHFYRYLTEGKSKPEALSMAQRDIRTMEAEPEGRKKRVGTRGRRNNKGKTHPYADPYYWAAFILLDGIE